MAERVRLRFAKRGAMRWTGHLDVRQSWERTFRRARVPLLHGSGFHPRPKLVFANPLPLGFTSDAELVDVWLEEELDAEQLLERLQRTAAPGLVPLEVRRLQPAEPTAAKLVVGAVYEVSIEAGLGPRAETQIARVLEATSLPRARRGRDYDLRPLVEQLLLDAATSRLRMRLSCTPERMGRPDELLDELDLDPHELTIERTALILRDASAVVPAEARVQISAPPSPA